MWKRLERLGGNEMDDNIATVSKFLKKVDVDYEEYDEYYDD